ncbi:MAG: DUF2062 domain-containing protein [Candidatus Aphodosoma sp.]
MNECISQYKAVAKEKNIVVVIPVYNNSRTIAKVIQDAKQYVDDVWVVNDGSTDSTLDILSTIEGVHVLSYSENRGKGYALRLAIKETYNAGYRYMISMDADGQHFASDIPYFIEEIDKFPNSLIVGSRNLNADNMPGKNSFANKFSNFWYKVETFQKLSDTQSGFRLYPLSEIHNVHFYTNRYEFEVEVLVRSAWRGVRVVNIPISVYYPPKEERVSHFKPAKDFTRISILNTILVLVALLVYYPYLFFKSLSVKNIKAFFDKYVFNSSDSNIKMSASIALGVFSGIIPIWGYQLVFAGLSAHVLKLNKVVAMISSNISIPPMIPFILYGSLVLGGVFFKNPVWIDIHQISIHSVASALLQYVIGSILLAIIAFIIVFLFSFCLLSFTRHKKA